MKKQSLRNQKIRRILTNIAANIAEYHIISKLIFLRIIHDKAIIFVKMYVKYKKTTCFKLDLQSFGQNYRVTSLSTFYITVSEIS